MSEILKKTKEAWLNKQTRAIVVLGFYIVFFGLILLIFWPTQPHISIPVEEEEKEENDVDLIPDIKDFFAQENYQYQLIVKDIDNNEFIFEVKVIEGEAEVSEEENEILETALLFNNIMLNRLVKNADLKAKTYYYDQNERHELYFLDDNVTTQILFVEDLAIEMLLIFEEEEINAVQIVFYDQYEDVSQLDIIY